jgi:hypothetical protein
VIERRPGVDHRGEPVPQQHLRELVGQPLRRQSRGALPLRLGEVDVAFLEPGGDIEAPAVDLSRAVRDRQLCGGGDHGDLPVTDEDRRVGDRLGGG